MTRRRLVAAVAAAVVALSAASSARDTADLTILCSTGLKAVIDDLAPKYERASKHTLAVRYDLAANIKKQIEGGEPFDVAFVTPAVMDDLIKGGKVAADSRNTIARSGLAIAIRKGAKKHDISTVDALKRALLDAKGIAYAKEGASGVAFAALIQKLGLADAVKAKSTLTASADAVGDAVASGKSEFGILPVSEILPIKGAELLAPFPADVQSYIVIVGGVSAASKHDATARDVIKFVTAPAALPVIKAKGMERER